MGRKKRPRGGDAVSGILLLDKPAGVTSNGALQRAKTLLGAGKGGHTGSLDPIATGLLPLCFGESTKVSGFFLDSDKRYWTRIRLGRATSTGDSEGETVFETRATASERQVSKALNRFRGAFDQTPPMYSAVKKGGQPLYKLARLGIEVEREPKRVNVYSLELTAFDGRDLELDIRSSRGFYVRALAHDLGEALDVGGHVTALRRLAVGSLSIEHAVTLERLAALDGADERRKILLPPDTGLSHVPRIDLSVDAAFYLVRGQTVSVGRVPKEGWVRLYSDATGFLGLGAVTDDGRIAPRRLFRPAAG